MTRPIITLPRYAGASPPLGPRLLGKQGPAEGAIAKRQAPARSIARPRGGGGGRAYSQTWVSGLGLALSGRAPVWPWPVWLGGPACQSGLPVWSGLGGLGRPCQSALVWSGLRPARPVIWDAMNTGCPRHRAACGDDLTGRDREATRPGRARRRRKILGILFCLKCADRPEVKGGVGRKAGPGTEVAGQYYPQPRSHFGPGRWRS